MEDKKDLLKRITRYLMLRASFLQNIGLLNGKLGIAIFFYKYSRYIQNDLYSDFAGELIDEIYAEIHTGYPTDFENGLSGIAWGMEYIIRNRFVEANPDEVLRDLDIQILERDVRKVTDNSLETGLNGLAHYVLCRCVDRYYNQYFGKSYINNLIISMKKNKGEKKLIGSLSNLVNDKRNTYSFNLLDTLSVKCKYNKKELPIEKLSLGITENGLTRIAIKLLNEITS